MVVDSAGHGPELTDRVRELETRLAALERAVPAVRPDDDVDPRGVDVPAEPDSEQDTFWVLHGLKERIPEPGAVLFAGAVRLPAGERVEWQQGVETDAVVHADWSTSAEVLAALGHPVRLALLREVLQGVRTSTELGAVEGLGTSGQLYHHLRPLLATGWLRSVGRGRYEVPAVRVIPLLAIITAAQR